MVLESTLTDSPNASIALSLLPISGPKRERIVLKASRLVFTSSPKVLVRFLAFVLSFSKSSPTAPVIAETSANALSFFTAESVIPCNPFLLFCMELSIANRSIALTLFIQSPNLNIRSVVLLTADFTLSNPFVIESDIKFSVQVVV